MLKQSVYVEPSSHSNQYTEFIVPAYPARNFRMIAFGINSYTGGNDRHYSHSCGALSLIDTITVYSGSTVVSQTRGANYLSAFKEMSEGGVNNISIGSTVYQNSLNYALNATINVNKVSDHFNTAGIINTGMVELYKLCPFFLGLDVEGYSAMAKAVKKNDNRKKKQLIKSSNVIRCDKLNLRIVIQYTSLSPDLLFVNGVATDTYVINRPVLVMDKIMGAELKDNFQIVYDNHDLESFTIKGAVADTDMPMEQIKLYGANDKFVHNVILINSGETSHNYFKMFRSVAMNKEEINLVVNGELLLNFNMDSPARKQMFLNYSKPQFMCPMLSNLYGHAAAENNQLYGPDNGTTIASENFSEFSYLSLDIGQKISQLALQYKRRTYRNGTQTNNFNMLCFYTTQRVLSYSNGVLNVSY
jgi:hypothetical protein